MTSRESRRVAGILLVILPLCRGRGVSVLTLLIGDPSRVRTFVLR